MERAGKEDGRQRLNDLIIDCFAGGGGASVGIEMALGRSVDIAINHDPEAIKMHRVFYNYDDVIAWAPLPEPYKENEE